MKISKNFYHGTSLENYNSIICDGMLNNGDYVCLTDDFNYAKTYALLSSSSAMGVILMFKQTIDLPLKTWMIYFLRRNLLRPIFKKYDWFTNSFNGWGFAENAIELCRNHLFVSDIKKVYKLK